MALTGKTLDRLARPAADLLYETKEEHPTATRRSTSRGRKRHWAPASHRLPRPDSLGSQSGAGIERCSTGSRRC